MQQFELACPHCGEIILWEEGDPEFLSCFNCDGLCIINKINDGNYTLMAQNGQLSSPCPHCGEQLSWNPDDSTSFICDNCNGACDVIRLEDGSYKLLKAEDDDNDAKWDLLVHKIMRGEIIPVIGEELVLNKSTVKQILINSMCKSDNIAIDKDSEKPESYSQLIYHKHYSKDREHIYARITKSLEKYSRQFKPSDVLMRILSIREFPFVITISTDPIIENAMKRIWRDRGRVVKTLVFNNDPREIDTKGDLSKDSDIEIPTIYYMFGKADTNVPHRFVVTDEDMLAFCQSWLTEGRRPKILSRVIGGKELLFIGCNYPDWLVRFIWYSMRKNLEKSGMLVSEKLEPSLEDFMKRVHVETQNNPLHVVEQIEGRLSRMQLERTPARFDVPMERTDVFISYSRDNEQEARTLYDALTAVGLNVWYDRKNLLAGDQWLSKIKDAIESTKYFVALLSESMKQQTTESHVYRKEWNMAIDNSKGMGSRRGFIIPVTLDGLDIYADKLLLDLPDELPGHNALSISSSDDYKQVAEEILKRINGLSK